MDRYKLFMQLNMWDDACVESRILGDRVPLGNYCVLEERRRGAGDILALDLSIEKAWVPRYEVVVTSSKFGGFSEYKVCFISRRRDKIHLSFCWRRYSEFCCLWEGLSTDERISLGGLSFPSKTQLFTSKASIEESRRIKFDALMRRIVAALGPFPNVLRNWLDSSFEERAVSNALDDIKE